MADGEVVEGFVDGADAEMSEPILQFFAYGHLSPPQAAVARPFADLAHHLVRAAPRNPERTAALRKLLEAKDAAVRATLFAPIGA